jgi:hypothetical protein
MREEDNEDEHLWYELLEDFAKVGTQTSPSLKELHMVNPYGKLLGSKHDLQELRGLFQEHGMNLMWFN